MNLENLSDPQKLQWAEDHLKLLVTPQEFVQLVRLAWSAQLSTAQGPVSFADSLVSMVQSIQNRGSEQKDKLLEIARKSPVERDAQFELYDAVQQLRFKCFEKLDLGCPEGEAKRHFRKELLAVLHRFYPEATEQALYLTIGQCFEDVPGCWNFNIARCVLALRNPKRL